MEGPVNSGGDAVQPEGVKYLHLLGLGHLVGQEITVRDTTIQAENFLQVCGEHARPFLMGLEASLNTPDNTSEAQEFRDALRAEALQRLGLPPAEG